MKKFLFIGLAIFVSLFLKAQSVEKGSFIGFHIISADLRQGVTKDDFIKFYNSRMIPQMESSFPETKVYLLESIRGENTNTVGIMWVFKSESDRNRYFNEDGSTTPIGNEAYKKVNSLNVELANYVNINTIKRVYTDWKVL